MTIEDGYASGEVENGYAHLSAESNSAAKVQGKGYGEASNTAEVKFKCEPPPPAAGRPPGSACVAA